MDIEDFIPNITGKDSEIIETNNDASLRGHLHFIGLENIILETAKPNNAGVFAINEIISGIQSAIGEGNITPGVTNANATTGTLVFPESYPGIGPLDEFAMNGNKLYKVGKAPEPLRSQIHSVAKEWGLDPLAFEVMIGIESGYKMLPPNSKGYSGYTQVSYTDDEAKGYNINDPIQNLTVGAKQLASKLKYWKGDYLVAVMAYNAGNGRVKQWNKIPKYLETQNHIKKFVYNYNLLRNG